MLQLNYNTLEGTELRHIKTQKLGTLKLDYPHKKVLQLECGQLLQILPEKYLDWECVETYIDFTTGNKIVLGVSK